jgi:subtilisin family serine protease
VLGAQEYIDKKVAKDSPAIQAARKRWQEVTHKAAQSGVNIFVASGNSQAYQRAYTSMGIPVDKNISLAFLGMSDDVVVVGASDDQGKHLAPFSSGGDERFHPAVIAPGTKVNGEPDREGTSYASPLAAVVGYKMLKHNPALKTPQIKKILEETAKPLTDGTPSRLQGAGVINPEAAVQRASKTKEK